MPRKYKAKKKEFTSAVLPRALAEVENGLSFGKAAHKYGLSKSMLRNRFRETQGLVQMGKQGRKTAICPETEEKLANCIRKMAELGFGPTIHEMQNIVRDYLVTNDIQNPFTNDMPGKDWSASFMTRHNLSLKKGGLMQIARKNVTSDPFVIYGFYDLLQKEVEKLGIGNRPECFWNCDESGFPQDPSRWKTVGPVGSKTIRVTCGPNRENTTVLAVCSAAGVALDPLIIFKGKNLQSSWHGSEALPETFYGTSDSGWMTTAIFHTWFTKFVERTKETRPLLLLFDGHLSHMSLKTVELAMKENISIVKLPAHCTDVLQPLDVACFSPLKGYYEEQLLDHIHQTGARDPLRKPDFVNLICRIWRKGLSENNIKAGFNATGVYPVDANQYKKSRIDQVKMHTYQEWKAAGCPLDEDGSPLLPERKGPSLPTGDEEPSLDESFLSVHSFASSSGTQCSHSADTDSCDTSSTCSSQSTDSAPYQNSVGNPKQLIRELQKYAPPGMKYAVTLVPVEHETSFEAIIKSRGRPASSSQPSKRRKMSMHGSILTDGEFRAQIREKEEEEERKQQRRTAKKDATATRKRQQKKPAVSSSSESESDTESDTEPPPISLTEKDVGRYYAVYWEKPWSYYWGKMTKVFTQDEEDNDAEEAEFKFLHKRPENGNDADGILWDWPTKPDIDIVKAKQILFGPTDAVLTDAPRGKSHFQFPAENVVMQMFKSLSKSGLKITKNM